MKLGSPINIRLSIESEAMYEAEARARNVPLRTYLLQKLEEGDNIAEEISRLRLAIEQISTEQASIQQKSSFDHTSNGAGSGVLNMSLLLEMLLLLRQIAQPHRVHVAQQELKRLGFEIWEAEEHNESR